MGQMLSTTSLTKSPVVNVKNKAGEYFIGTLTNHKQTDSQYKNEDGTKRKYDIYEFAVEDTDMAIQIKNGKSYEDTNVEPGATVAVFASTRLNNALLQAPLGSRLKIIYLGLGKATKFGGKPHEYTVEVL